MKRFRRALGILVALGVLFVVAASIFPLPLARAAIALADEVSVERVFMNVADAPAQRPPPPISLRGSQLEMVRQGLKIKDDKGVTCFCKGDFRLRFKRFGLTLASFSGHLGETPPRIISSKPLNLDPKGAHRLAVLFDKIVPR